MLYFSDVCPLGGGRKKSQQTLTIRLRLGTGPEVYEPPGARTTSTDPSRSRSGSTAGRHLKFRQCQYSLAEYIEYVHRIPVRNIETIEWPVVPKEGRNLIYT